MLEKWFGLSGKAALVVGVGGLGKEIAVALAHAGADVACSDLFEQKVDETVAAVRSAGRRSLAIHADVTQEEDVKKIRAAAVKEFGRIDILVYTVGILRSKPTLDLNLKEWQLGIDINLTGAFLVCREVGKIMKEKGGGRIILIGSAFGDRILPIVLPYTVSKGGVLQMVHNLAFEWARYGIRVNGIAPGYFNTEMPGEALSDPASKAGILKRIPLRRVGEPHEIGPLAVYLASSASDYMTGEVIRIDGGQSYFTV